MLFMRHPFSQRSHARIPSRNALPHGTARTLPRSHLFAQRSQRFLCITLSTYARHDHAPHRTHTASILFCYLCTHNDAFDNACTYVCIAFTICVCVSLRHARTTRTHILAHRTHAPDDISVSARHVLTCRQRPFSTPRLPPSADVDYAPDSPILGGTPCLFISTSPGPAFRRALPASIRLCVLNSQLPPRAALGTRVPFRRFFLLLSISPHATRPATPVHRHPTTRIAHRR
ncbi:hypothetical protein C8R43DRAFT_328860 [Mycena crocata]|nr:hypothetical protein C8R43DRAFT_328860 [Mycena crocata]